MTLARAEIVVDLAAIRHNVRTLQQTTGVEVIVVVKADGYGHGMAQVAGAARAAGATWLAVATPDEALALRAVGDTGRLLCWLTVPGEPYADAIAAGIDLTAYSVAELDEIAAAAESVEHPVGNPVGHPDGHLARVQLKVDTGLSRGGAPREAWAELFARARAGEEAGHWLITGVWSHLACSDEPEHPANDHQEQAFRDALSLADEAGLRPGLRHLANSAAAILRPSARFDAVRCGIASYGLDPAPGHTPDLGLVPAMTVRARLALVKTLAAGDSVSYGHTWTAQAPTTVGLVPAGYGEGVPRHASGVASVGVAGIQRPIRGRVCMDQFLVDLGPEDDSTPHAGDEVLLLGPGRHGEPTAQDWAEACDTISYEIVTRIGGRMTRTHVDSDTEKTHDTASQDESR
ncbi:alanine racemase [Nocardioides sp.]|uniref:alanine racemase n=1 Tax=Nocardioides sp. TaxID=35761 RepID=UPI00286A17F6|nr:alanine racemase [Nocardioides sp.]